MSGSDLGKPIMITNSDSPSAKAFQEAAKNVAAQCSIVAAKLQEEMMTNSEEPETETESVSTPQDAGQSLGSASAGTTASTNPPN